jgi:HAD superfamily hydrolase (TIGR01457 family)
MIKGYAVDMDGTVYLGKNVIPGAREFISGLKARNIQFVFITNNSSRARSFYYDKLKNMGFDVSIENVLTSGTAAIRFLKDRRTGKTVYPLGTEGFVSDLREAGVMLSDRKPDIVLLSFDTTITYDKIDAAYHYILEGAEFIATHPDELCPNENGYDVDIGPFINMLERLTGKRALVIGKPHRLMLDMAAAEMGLDPSEVAMVGDRLYTDMKMAIDAGTPSILVLSGETSVEDLKKSGMRPDFVFDSVAEIIPKLMDRRT